MFTDRLDPRLTLSWMERLQLRQRASDVTPSQRERMLIVAVCGEADGPVRMLAQCRLEHARNLLESGRIGEGVDRG
jgi:hypothetical protein